MSDHENLPEELSIPDVKRDVDTILVPIDGSVGSERGLAYASLLATITRAEVVVMVAFNPPVAIRRRGLLAVEQARVEMEEDAKDLATEAATLMIDRGHRVRSLVVEGEPAEAILETAEAENVDLIVMGRRGRSRLKGMLLGSVSDKVVRHAGIPVFLAS
jgi:nucleotide-binding universal stress UspA family protein